jgi:guanyl-specific ribonuclease Sa
MTLSQEADRTVSLPASCPALERLPDVSRRHRDDILCGGPAAHEVPDGATLDYGQENILPPNAHGFSRAQTQLGTHWIREVLATTRDARARWQWRAIGRVG